MTNFHPEIDQDLKPVYSTQIDVRWGDMDAYGHVNNAVYFRYMEEARVQLLQKMGITMDAKGTGPVIINVGCTFLKPLTYPDTVRIDCFMKEPGRSSVMSYYKIFSQKNLDQAVCEGHAKIVWVNHLQNKSTSLPEKIVSMINQQTQL